MKVKGWKEVFKFSFMQQIKTKSFIISTVVIAFIAAIMAFLADFLPAILLEDEINKVSRAVDGENMLTVEIVYLDNETGYDFNFDTVASENNVAINEVTAEEADAKILEIADTTERAVVTKITAGDNGFSVDSRYADGKSAVNKYDSEMLNSAIAGAVRDQVLLKLGVPEDSLGLAKAEVAVSCSSAGQEPVSFVQQILNTVVPMVSAIILFMFIFSYSSMVAQSVAIEKASRVIEYLLTSIKPLAIILGKVLAMCCVSILQFLLIGLGGTFGFLVSLPFGILTKMGPMIGSAAQQMQSAATSGAGAGAVDNAAEIVGGISESFSHVDASAFIVMIVVFILGFLFYAGIAGLAGASVSKMEDLSSAIQPLSLIGVLGFYLAYFPQVTGEENTMALLARYLPISSPFVLPSDYLLGRIDLVGTLIAIAVLAVADILIMMFVAKVYESLILHTGNRLKLGDILKMSK